jgi:adenine-specific DNA-methyltransferase
MSTVSDVGKERIQRVIKNQEENKGVGYKLFKLSQSNIVAWDPNAEDLEGSLFDVLDSVRLDRTERDVLYELLLKYGLDLAVPIEERDIAGRTVFLIGAGALVVCLADDVNLDVVKGIAALKDELTPEVMRVVFKDVGFADDVVKANTVQILRQAGIEDVKSL